MTCAVLAQHTERLKFGAMFHQVVCWHPLRLAEDFAIADIMSGGRMLFGTGRGSVERENAVFGVGFGRSGDEGDRANRELFEEQMEIMKLAWSQPRFSYQGRFYQLPPPGLTDRGGAHGEAFDTLTLVPAPLHPVEIWQALGSEPTLHYAAEQRHKGVIPCFNRRVTLPKWQLFGELIERYQGRKARPGEDRRLVTHIHLGDSRQAAMARVRPAHDERMRFLAGQRPLFGYLTEDGTPFPYGRIPTLEESMEQGGWFVGTPEQVRDGLLELAAEFGLEYLAVEVQFAGLSADQIAEQIDRFGRDVLPALDRGSSGSDSRGEPNGRPAKAARLAGTVQPSA